MKREAPIGTTWDATDQGRLDPDAGQYQRAARAIARLYTNLRTVCDPAGDVTELFRLQTENRILRRECERFAKKAGEWPITEKSA